MAGSLYRISGVFEDEKMEQYDCLIEIWEKKWENPIHKFTLKKQEKLDIQLPIVDSTDSTSSGKTIGSYFTLISIIFSCAILNL